MAKTKTNSRAKPARNRVYANRPDRIFKENLKGQIPTLLRYFVGLVIVAMEAKNVELHHTRERKADFIGIVTDSNGRKFVLHIEFQVRNDPKMLFRMLEYKAMLRRKFPKMEIVQFVIMVGKNAPTMVSSLNEPDHVYRYNLVWIQQLDYRLLLSSNVSEAVLLAVLGDFGGQPPEIVAKEILQKLERTASSELEFQRYASQLRIISTLRNLRPLIDKLMENISRFFVETRDPLYKKGMEKGMEKGLEKGELKGKIEALTEKTLEVIVKLIQESDHDNAFIGRIAGAETQTVKKIREVMADFPDDFEEKLSGIQILPK